MKTSAIILTAMLSGLSMASFAQRPARTSMYLKAAATDATPMLFNPAADISQFATPAAPIEWGMDVAWNDGANVKRGTNFIGADILSNGVGRVSFQPSDLVDAQGNLSVAQQYTLQSRLDNIAFSNTKNIVLNCDHEVLCNKEAYPNADQNYANYNGKPNEWYRVIKASIEYCRRQGFKVVAVSPFNEPDYTPWKEGTQADFKEIARLITSDQSLAGIRICAGNTLNCDQALSWYNAVKPYVSEGNTHQLAGSFDNYAKFWQTVRNDGFRTTADELHNTMEAFVGAHYGMQAGIWWGWDGITRGEFCKASTTGKEIAYAEDRNSWTAAAAYKRPNGRTDIFLGGSERQAYDHSYDFAATNRPTYFDGHGPLYNYPMDYPGGTGYSTGQANAETMIQIHQGEDVPLEPVARGTYYIMNANSGMFITFPSRTVATGKQLQQYLLSSNATTNLGMQWKVSPVGARSGGDYTYFYLRAQKDTIMMMDLNEFSTETGGVIIGYPGNGGAQEQWSAEYAGNGNWYIRSRHSGLYLEVKGGSKKSGTSGMIQQSEFTGELHQQWRFVPITNAYSKADTDAPSVPAGLTATLRGGSVALNWQQSTDAASGIAGYVVLRSNNGGSDWDVIGRMLTDTVFTDNEVFQSATPYIYKVKAVDVCRNQSEASQPVSITTGVFAAKGLVAKYGFDDTTEDASDNLLDGVIGGVQDKAYSTTKKEGTKAFYFNGSRYLQMPAGVVNSDEWTFATWANRNYLSPTNARLLDFFGGEGKAMTLIPTTGSDMRFIMRNGAAEEVLTTTALGTGWHHIAVTIGKESVKLYVDGVLKASSESKTVRPSDIRPVINYVGKTQNSAFGLFRGYIDDARIYSYELTEADIQSVMAFGDPAPPVEPLLKGDVDGDGYITMADANMVVNYYLGVPVEGFNLQAADMDGDGYITMADANAIVNVYLGM